jgi:peptidyl-dipeptidase Dcp
MRDNPFIAEYNTIHNTTPFKLIETEDYEPAILEGIRKQNEAILQITDNIEKPSFDNTIVALERSGELLDRVITVFSNLLSAETNDKLQELAERLMPMVSEHSNNILLNEKLYARIKEVYNSDESSNLNYEQTMLLNKTYDSFVRHGANLSNSEKDIYRSLTSKLTTLTLKFSQNILKETNNFQLVIDNDDDLQGLPEYSIRAAKELAEKKAKLIVGFSHFMLLAWFLF